jgi:hypothetical protein
MRIKARAIDRCGEILRQIPADAGGRPSKTQDGDGPSLRAQAATTAGMSERQLKTALRVRAVPRELFEELVESDDPPTITQLAQLGTKKLRECCRGWTGLIGPHRYPVDVDGLCCCRSRKAAEILVDGGVAVTLYRVKLSRFPERK